MVFLLHDFPFDLLRFHPLNVQFHFMFLLAVMLKSLFLSRRRRRRLLGFRYVVSIFTCSLTDFRKKRTELWTIYGDDRKHGISLSVGKFMALLGKFLSCGDLNRMLSHLETDWEFLERCTHVNCDCLAYSANWNGIFIYRRWISRQLNRNVSKNTKETSERMTHHSRFLHMIQPRRDVCLCEAMHQKHEREAREPKHFQLQAFSALVSRNFLCDLLLFCYSLGSFFFVIL